MSPDAAFPVTQLPLVVLPVVTNTPLAEIEKMISGASPVPKDGDLQYALGLACAYGPSDLSQPIWLFDAGKKFRDDVWQRWLDNDPLTIAQKNPHAFAPTQAIYLEGAANDEFSANIGARKVYEVLRNRPARCVFYEPPGHHSDHVRERLQRGLEWVFNHPLRDIK
jgi:hypothetical protein